MILTDHETKIDLLNNEPIASTIVKLLRDQPDRPITIGVHGDWGAGKSSILEMIEAGFADAPGVLCLKFNGWRFQGFEDAKIALIEGIVTALVKERPIVTKAAETVKEVFRRIDWLKVAKKAGGLALTTFTGVPTPDQLHAVVDKLRQFASDPTQLATKENLVVMADGISSILTPSAETNVPKEVEAFRKAFDDLLDKAGIKQLIVLIDDLDRCLPDTAIETLEAIRLFVFTSHTAFVVAADEAMIEYAVRKHFPDLPDTTGPRDYARNYLEKLIQVPFRIPALGETETRIYVTLLLIGAQAGEADAGYVKLIGFARDRLKRPWTTAALDVNSVKTAFGGNTTAVQNTLALSDQIGPILATGTRGNPRQIKRFLNTLLLRKETADARGFGDDVHIPVLAKLMLAERFIPRLFDQIAFSAVANPKGYCEELTLLEAAKENPKPDASAKSSPAGKDASDTVAPALAEWLGSGEVRAWARIEPPLANVDLRPYLFVTKDRKDYFGASSVLGRLAAVVERLFGTKMSVQAQESELKQLVLQEAAQVFEAVRSRLMSVGTLETEPQGIAGISVLVRAHPTLQASLLDFLESLPTDRCGPWAVSGWESVIKDPDAIVRFDRLLEGWSSSAKNPLLKATAAATLKTRRAVR